MISSELLRLMRRRSKKQSSTSVRDRASEYSYSKKKTQEFDELHYIMDDPKEMSFVQNLTRDDASKMSLVELKHYLTFQADLKVHVYEYMLNRVA